MKQRKQTTNRRDFLATAATTAAAISCPYIITSSALGAGNKPAASERIVMAGIGIGNQGIERPGRVRRPQRRAVRRRLRREKGAARKRRRSGRQPLQQQRLQGLQRFPRRCSAGSDIDAVHIATPDHWHAIMVIEACRHGKDVYCQKPESRTIREGRLMVDAARRYRRVVSGGSQRVLEDYRGVTEMLERRVGHDQGNLRRMRPAVEALQSAGATGAGRHRLGHVARPRPVGSRITNTASAAATTSTAPVGVRGSDYSGGGMTDWGAAQIRRRDVRRRCPRSRADRYHSRPTARSTNI